MKVLNNFLLISFFMPYVTEQFERCDLSHISCQNDQCINLDQLCDGIIDCENGFDEELSTCTGIKCPKFTFQCLYGACISKNLKCNGVKNCHDGSDEATTICGSVTRNAECLKSEFECKNLQCISTEKLCDGKIDCTDGSDETIEQCGRVRCPPFSFRCNYGACIARILKCNHIEDCADGSDEINCIGFNIETTTANTLKTTNTLEIQQTTSIIPTENSKINGCHVPNDSMLTLIDDLNGNILNSQLKAPIETFVKYSCPKGTFLKGKFNTNFCDGFNWINPHPECIRLCAPITGHTIHVLCTNNGEGVDCSRPVESGTIAKISCAVMYEKPHTRNVHEDSYCDSDGNWSHTPFKCEQICGTIDTKIPFSIMSDITEVTKVPWQVAIYSKIGDVKYKFICGGTLIESRIVISAAHCFWNSKTSSLFDVSNYAIAVGKFYQDYYATNETQTVQYSNISKIDIPLQFRGGDYDFISDVAVLTLTDHIEYRNHIRPACLTWRSNNEKTVESNKLGIVAGWGVTETGKLSPDLRSVTLLSIDGPNCIRKKITRNDRIANDKFCVETSDGQNVCRGDSGGGFIVSEDINGISYYHLWGIVSSGITSTNFAGDECNSDFVTTFTNIQWYESLVKTAIANIYLNIDE